MGNPVKITPDRIKSAIVEIKYTSKLPFEVIIGLFYKILDDTYNYTNRPIQHIKVEEGPEIPLGIQHIFYNNKIHLHLQPGSLVFNGIQKDANSNIFNYIGWDNYMPEILKILNEIKDQDILENYIRIGIRYNSEYPEIDIRTSTKFNFTFGLPEIISNKFSFSSEFIHNEHRVILQLLNKNNTSDPNNIKATSVIDIDIIKENLNINKNDFEQLIPIITKAHDLEKEIFFKLLQPDFFNSLNPTY
ncbi:MAG: TIGR04255 family protein [Saprospiraceae bacterium]|nr:TIGR04255 family protein [Candidatus Vicinibacter affinis]MBK8642380.1 TIGR04255 family protein [Candidatus Vicinibacter affinis]